MSSSQVPGRSTLLLTNRPCVSIAQFGTSSILGVYFTIHTRVTIDAANSQLEGVQASSDPKLQQIVDGDLESPCRQHVCGTANKPQTPEDVTGSLVLLSRSTMVPVPGLIASRETRRVTSSEASYHYHPPCLVGLSLSPSVIQCLDSSQRHDIELRPG